MTAHTAFLYYRAVNASGMPLSSNRDWYLLAAWVLAVVYLYLLCFRPRTPFGLFLLPLVLGLIATAALLADPQPFAREPASKVWGIIHGTSIMLATVAVLVGFAAGVMYLGQALAAEAQACPLRARCACPAWNGWNGPTAGPSLLAVLCWASACSPA